MYATDRSVTCLLGYQKAYRMSVSCCLTHVNPTSAESNWLRERYNTEDRARLKFLESVGTLHRPRNPVLAEPTARDRYYTSVSLGWTSAWCGHPQPVTSTTSFLRGENGRRGSSSLLQCAAAVMKPSNALQWPDVKALVSLTYEELEEKKAEIEEELKRVEEDVARYRHVIAHPRRETYGEAW